MKDYIELAEDGVVAKFKSVRDKLCGEKPELKEEMEVIFRSGFEERGERALRRLSLPEIAHVEGSLHYRKNLEELMRCDLLLIFLSPGRKTSVPAKLYEYLNTKKPILGLMREGDCANLIRETKTGVVVDPSDMEQIASVVYEFYQKWKRGQQVIDPDWKLINQFERKSLTAKLAEVFEECSGK